MRTISIAIVSLMLLFSMVATAQERNLLVEQPIVRHTPWYLAPLYSHPEAKLDHAWNFTKAASFAAVVVDARTTANEIRRGYVEASPLDNLVINREDPAFAKRALWIGLQTWGINALLDLAYHRPDCRQSKICKIAVIGAGNFFTGRSVANSLHNLNLP